MNWHKSAFTDILRVDPSYYFTQGKRLSSLHLYSHKSLNNYFSLWPKRKKKNQSTLSENLLKTLNCKLFFSRSQGRSRLVSLLYFVCLVTLRSSFWLIAWLEEEQKTLTRALLLRGKFASYFYVQGISWQSV